MKLREREPNVFRFMFSPSRPPKGRERVALENRRELLRTMEASVAEATARLRVLVEEADLDALRLRHGFVRLEIPTAKDASDRRAPAAEHRPSATRLMSPHGIALPFNLIALLEAQTRTKPGKKPSGNPMPLRGGGSQPAWSDYLATDAVDSGTGRGRQTVMDKKVLQLHRTLKRLRAEKLVDLPNVTAKRGTYEGFLLNREDGRRLQTPDHYRVPEGEDEFFAVPLSMFTNGWIYVLEDSELALLLITARNRHLHGAEEQPLRGGVRVMNYGLGPDSFEAAYRVLEYLGLIEVSSDYRRHQSGRVHNYAKTGADPHQLLFLPEGLERPAAATFLVEIEDQLAQPEPTDDGQE
jgi:hypothetical protein